MEKLVQQNKLCSSKQLSYQLSLHPQVIYHLCLKKHFN